MALSILLLCNKDWTNWPIFILLSEGIGSDGDVRIITKKRLEAAKDTFPLVAPQLDRWFAIAKAARWNHFEDLKATFPHADVVKTKSKRSVYVFNLGTFRLICAVHFDKDRIFILRFLSHKDYDLRLWIKQL